MISLNKMISLGVAILGDIRSFHSTSQKEYSRDVKTLTERTKNEGLSFLTKTLPALCHALERGLETGLFHCPQGFLRRRGTLLPAFCKVWFQIIFDDNGILRRDFDPTILKDLRTLLTFFKKVELPYNASVMDDALGKFVSTDAALPKPGEDLLIRVKDSWVSNAAISWAKTFLIEAFQGVDMKDIVPRHSGGAVATRETPADKRVLRRLYDNIHQAYPYYEYAYVNICDLRHRKLHYKSLERLPHSTARIVAVPKDSKGPRLISMEPLETQFFQQGQLVVLNDVLARKFPGVFSHQDANRHGAYQGSIHGNTATLDLSEASDRVSLCLVRALFPEHITRYLEATRSSHVEIRDGITLKLNKFASMGSALCFPVEQMVFYSLIYGVQRALPSLGQKDLLVFGDDIIIDTAYVAPVRELFSRIGLVINEDKSFSKGFFRESCGGDYYKGNDVVGIKLRKPIETKPSASTIVSHVSTANQLYDCGYNRAAQKLRHMVEETIGYSLPPKRHEDAYLGWHSRISGKFNATRKWNKNLQRFEFKLSYPYSDSFEYPSDVEGEDSPEYFRKITQGWQPEYRGFKYSVPHTLKIKRGWFQSPCLTY